MADAAFWRGKRVLVTGASGLLGSWMVSRLLEFGAEVVVLLRDLVPTSWLILSGNIHRVTVVRGVLEDYFLLARILNEYEIDSIFHLAAQAIVRVANRSPLSTFESNIKGTWCLLEAVRVERGVARVVVASSDKAYGTQAVLPYSEEAPLLGGHPYDTSKACADLLAQSYARTYGLPIAITRCGNLFGGGDFNFDRLIPGTIRSLLQDEAPIIRSDGSYVRDYFYVKDAVDGYLLLAEHLEDITFHGSAFNFSAEQPLTVQAVVELLADLLQIRHEPIVLNQAQGEIHSQHLSSRKARERLQWFPRYPLRDALRETIEWYKIYLPRP